MNSNIHGNLPNNAESCDLSNSSAPFVNQALNIHDFNIVHVVTDCDADRATRAHLLFSMGYHVEIYASSDELLTYSPPRGIVFIRDNNNELAMQLVNKMKIIGYYLPVIGYCKNFNIDKLISSIRSGVVDFVIDSIPPKSLKDKIEIIILESMPIIINYENYIKASLLLKKLSKREFSVLAHLADGKTSKEIAIEMGISPRTIEIHRRHILEKLSVRTTIDAVRIKYKSENL